MSLVPFYSVSAILQGKPKAYMNEKQQIGNVVNSKPVPLVGGTLSPSICSYPARV
jgi:hypothetical protein